MKPTAVQGINLSFFPNSKISLGGSYLQKFTTWGVETWKKTGNIIGHFGNGFDLNGNSFTYRDKIMSDGVVVGFASVKPAEGLNIQMWNYAILDVNNSINLKVDLSKQNWILGISSLFQRPLGGSDNEIYYRSDERTNAVSLRAGYKMDNLQAILNYTRVGKGGRYIFPREFGTENGFYTFLPRMRIEGFGDVHSWMGSIRLTGIDNFTLNTSYGINVLPSSSNYRLNKLGFDDYHQLMLDFRYRLKNDKANFRFLYIATNTGGRIEFPQSSFNKYFFRHFNLVLNYIL